MIDKQLFRDDGNFYSHAREGRDGGGIDIRTTSVNFYSHAREGRDQDHTGTRQAELHFYSHAREGRDVGLLSGIAQALPFLLTRPRGA